MRILLILSIYLSCLSLAIADDINIGVLAYNGKLQAVERLQPTADYLSQKIPQHKFKIIPLTLKGFENALNKKQLDFILTNPGHYIVLKHKFGADRMVTFLAKYKKQILRKLSAVIFTSKNSGIYSFKDLKNKTFGAVSKEAFGGFQLARYSFLSGGIDIIKDMNTKWLGFPHADIVNAVLTKKIDVGTVRSGVLEKMANRGDINLDDIQIIAKKQNKNYPFLRSSEFYPEWPFARLPYTNIELVKQVAIYLLKIKEQDIVAKKIIRRWMDVSTRLF